MADWDDVGYVLASKHRIEALRVLSRGETTPSQLASVLEKSRSTVSSLLRALSDKKVVECLNPSQRKGRLYSITDKGRDILQRAEKILSGEE
jgi:DNA-binding transcriptional ArsR family regulator